MHMKFKDRTINLNGLSEELLLALWRACGIWREHGMSSLVITSGNDGLHKTSSLHYTGNAVDIRSRDLPDSIGMANELRDSLDDAFDVILEHDHIHVEFDPKV